MIRIAVGVIALAVIVCAQRPTPPEIWEPQGNQWPEMRVYVRKNDNRTFECKAKGFPQPSYEWLKDGVKVQNMDDVVKVDRVTGTLTALKFFYPPNSGYYQCKATNSEGASMTPPIKILATDAQTFPGANQGTSTTDVTAYASTYLKMICKDIPESIPPYTFSWERGRREGGGGQLQTSKVDISERMIIDPDGHLHFLWVDPSDDGYIYVCKAKNDVIKIEMTNTKQTKLQVSISMAQDRSPELKYHTDVEVIAGDDAHLTCIFTYFSKSGEKLDIRWFLRGDEVGRGSTLIVPNVQVPTDTQNQEGTYLCEASLGEKKDRGWVELKVVAPPQFQPDKEPNSYSVPVDNDAVFYCNTTSHNSYSYPRMWMVNGNPIVGCPIGHFECAEKASNGYSKCIPSSERCDRFPDCDASSTKSSDEQNCKKEVTCGESNTKACRDKCIPIDQKCVPLVCEYPQFLCSDEVTCIGEKKVCDGIKDCGDGADENFCPGRDPTTAGRFTFSSDRAMLTLPNVRLDDIMCFQCSVANEHGVAFGDACLSIIDKIAVLLKPNDTYNVEPGTFLNIGVDATTDPLWQSQMKYEWYWYRQVIDPVTGEKSEDVQKVKLPPTDKFGRFFQLSQTGKNLTVIITDVESDDKEAFNIYQAMTKNGQKYAIKMSHRYDSFEMNFTIAGSEIEPPVEKAVVVKAASQNLWIIALVLGLIVLFVVIIIIVCFMYRNRGGTYLLDKKEHQAGHDPEQELKDSGFHDVSRVDDDDYDDEKPRPDEVSLSESVKPYESDEDMAEEYATDLSKFNEDGSFIGLYGDKKSKTSSGPREATV